MNVDDLLRDVVSDKQIKNIFYAAANGALTI